MGEAGAEWKQGWSGEGSTAPAPGVTQRRGSCGGYDYSISHHIMTSPAAAAAAEVLTRQSTKD